MRFLAKLLAIALALITLQLTPAAANATVLTNPTNSNFYEFVPSDLSQSDAALAASSLTYLGISGHLATIDSASENTFVAGLASGSRIWLGAQMTNDNNVLTYSWFVGPEASTVITSCVDGYSSCVDSSKVFSAWDSANQQPDAFADGSETAVAMSDDGTWQDCADSAADCGVDGYVVEFESSYTQKSVCSDTPVIFGGAFDGVAAVGDLLNVDPGTWCDGVSFVYSWALDGVAISGATDAIYFPVDSDVGHTLTVTVTGSWPGQTDVSNTSPSVKVFAADSGMGGGASGLPVVSITGDSSVGSFLSVDPGLWDDGNFTYQWFSCGAEVADAVYNYYQITEADLGCLLRVEVTGTLNGASGVVVSSDNFQVDSILAPVVDGPEALIFGYAIVNQTMFADTSMWPKGIPLEFQWLIDGEAISGATSSTYVVRPQDGGRLLSVTITGAPDGTNFVTSYSDTTEVSPADQTLTPTPVITGTFKVGKTLSVTTGKWAAGVEFAYQWYIDNDAVFGATDSTFELPAAAADLNVYVEVTGSLLGYNTSVQASDSDTVQPGTLKATAAPTITGTAKVGQRLTAVEHTWDSGVSFEYQWFAAAKAISGATSKTFKLTGAEFGKAITVKVTGSLLGYTSVTKASTATAKVALGDLSVAAVPQIVGSVKVGKSVSVNCGVWGEGAKFKIVWLLDGKPIKNATATKLKIDKKAKGHKLAVSVTGTAAGYSPLTKKSKAVKVG